MRVATSSSDRQHGGCLLSLGVGILGMGILGCGQPHSPANGAQVLHRGLSGEPATLDPAAAGDRFSFEVIEDLYEGLTSESPAGEVAPGVASSWSVDASGTEYTFELRRDAEWSNGKPVRAQDFIAAWQRTLDPIEASPVADDLRLIVGAPAILAGRSPASALGVEARGDWVLVVHLAKPAAYFPQLMAHSAAYPIYSQSSARTHDPAAWVSNGAYVLSAWSPGTAIELAKNPHYWNRSGVLILRIQFIVASDAHAQFMRYRAGELDMTDTVPENAVDALRRAGSTELITAPVLATAYYAFNLSGSSSAANLKLRQALSMAIDRRRLVQNLGFGEAPAFGFVPPGTWNYTPQSWDWRDLRDDERVAQAKRLYTEAGYSPHSTLHLKLLFNSNPSIEKTAILVAAMWRETLSVETELAQEEYRVFLQSRHDKSRWDVVRLAWTADFNDASDFLETFRSHSSNNDPGYVNPLFDEFLDGAASSADLSHRREFLERSERLMLADYPVAPLFFMVAKRMIKPYVRGVVINPLNHIRSQALALEAR
jgi:oligopeptide transport system substrate-binding protein